MFNCLAGDKVSFEVISQDLDSNGNIRIWTCHKIDDVEVKSQYPKINDHFVYCTRYSKQSFIGLDKSEIQAKIKDDITNHTYTLIKKEFDKNAVKDLKTIKKEHKDTYNGDFISTYLDDFIGTTNQEDKAEELIDTNGDGVNDKKLKVKIDGSYEEEGA